MPFGVSLARRLPLTLFPIFKEQAPKRFNSNYDTMYKWECNVIF
jgi:hypothetical protein